MPLEILALCANLISAVTNTVTDRREETVGAAPKINDFIKVHTVPCCGMRGSERAFPRRLQSGPKPKPKVKNIPNAGV